MTYRTLAVILGAIALAFFLAPLWIWALVGLSYPVGLACGVTAGVFAIASAAAYGATL